MAKWTKNHMMEIGAVIGVIGLILTLISWIYGFADTTPGWLDSYHDLVEREEGNYNLILFIVGPLLLIIGGFYFGEQIVLRRRFDRLLDTTKRSEFTSRRRDLEDLVKRLPDQYRTRLRDKESEFSTTSSRRAA